jgi:exopolysaccharide production protein ExoQ
MQFSIYPWDLKSWRSAFSVSGFPGIALFLLLLGAMLQVEDLSGGGAGHSSSTAILLIRTPAIVLAFLLLLFRPQLAAMRVNDLRFAYAAFAGLYLLSALWSHIPIQTLGKGAELVLAGVVFFQASRGDNPIARIEGLRRITLLTMSTLGMLAVMGFCLRLPAFVQHRAGLITGTTAQAPFLSGNGLGYVGSAIILVVLAEWQAHRLRTSSAIGQMLFALALFSVSASRTALGILLLSVLLVVFKRSKMIGVLAVAGVLVAGAMFSTEVVSRLQGQQNSSSFVTLSGRTVVWTAAVRQFEQNPVLGVGGGVGGKMVIANIGNMYLEAMSSLHNGFLEVLTGLGIIGFAIAVYMLSLATWRAWGMWNRFPQFAGTYVLIIHVWMTTIMSTGLLGWMGYEVAIFLCIITNLDVVTEGTRARVLVPPPLRWSAKALQPQNQAAH